ncbi:MAG: adenylate cyclase, partial [Gemmatimonadetes bacterium]|nr:adenylate cyclase [Gemmatimonadota bacterium]
MPLLDIAPTDFVDIAVVGLLLWGLVAWTRRVHARMALIGLAFLGAFYLMARQFELQLTAWIFQGFFAVLVVLLVVVFQDDLRRLFE